MMLHLDSIEYQMAACYKRQPREVTETGLSWNGIKSNLHENHSKILVVLADGGGRGVWSVIQCKKFLLYPSIEGILVQKFPVFNYLIHCTLGRILKLKEKKMEKKKKERKGREKRRNNNR